MKILHLLDERWDSGITAYALQSVDLLRRAGHDVVLGVWEGKKPERQAQDRGLPIVIINSVPQLWRVFRSAPWDIINVHNGRSHTWMVLFNLISKNKIPLIRTRGDARPVAINPLSRFVVCHTDAVISASENIAKQYSDGFGLKEKKLQTIYPSVFISRQEISPEPKRVGILGRLDPVKGHSVFLEAAAEVLKAVPEARFLVAGKEAGVSTALLENQSRVLGISHAVEFLGFQASAENFMKRCSVGVIASIGSEEISRACLEWLASGRPVVGTMVGSLPELIEPGETGFLVPPGDGHLMAEAITKLLQDTALCQAMGRKALQEAQLKFGSENQLKMLLALYNDIRTK